MGKLRVLFIVLTLIAAAEGVDAFGAVKSGSKCSKAGQTAVAGGYNYVCKKQGKSMIWVKGTKTKAQLPPAGSAATPSQTETQTGTSASQPGADSNGAGSNAGSSKRLSSFNEMDKCESSNQLSPGYRADGVLVYLSCGPDGRLHPQDGAPSLDQATGKPLKGPRGLLLSTVEYISPVASNSVPVTPTSPKESFREAAFCKIPDAGMRGAIPGNQQFHFTTGIALYPERARLMANPVIQFLPVDFPDLQGKQSPVRDYAKVSGFVESYWEAMAGNKSDVVIRIPETYLRLPKPVLDYDLASDFFTTGKPPIGTFDYAKAAIAAYDSVIDFSKVDIIAVVPPAEVTRQQIAGFTAEAAQPGTGFATNEKTIYNLLVSGGPVGDETFELLNWAHETGHMFGLTDARNVPQASQQDSSPLGQFDLMSSPYATELLAWNRFKLGAISDDQVRCVGSSGTTVTMLSPIERPDGGVKMVVIPTGEYTGIAVESRRAYGFDGNLGSASEGIIVYTIDTRIPYRQSPFQIVAGPNATDNQWRTDAAVLQGQSVLVGNIQIFNMESGAFGDVVKVIRN